MKEDEAVGWHHRLNGHELEQTPEDCRTGRPGCCSPLSPKESHVTERLNDSVSRTRSP